MSIAVSAVIRPSRLYLFLCLLFSLDLCITAVLLCHRLVELFNLVHCLAVLIVCVIPVFALLIPVFRSRNIVRIDISGNGQIRLFQTKRTTPPYQFQNHSEIDLHAGEIVRLLGDSTLWPHIMSLRLQSEKGKIFTVLVFPDSVEQKNYRSLMVALRCVKNHDAQQLSLP
jgi:toxin CptA